MLRDYSRAYQSKTYLGNGPAGSVSPRPVQLSIWYPAKPGSEKQRLTIGRYRLLSQVEKAVGDWTEPERRAFMESTVQAALKRGRTAEETRSWLQTETMAVMDAAMADGSFPLIVYGP
ncbi:MAG: hypothetical protein L0229_19930, partial [Blastocatellia bacterium]|nr:hypothetical protein [Blastocatellia bacterium]